MEVKSSWNKHDSLVKDTFPDICIPFNLDNLLSLDVPKFVEKSKDVEKSDK